ncbi:hypothetical protein LT679_06725 [Mucilaginibacter roseus]|uniref:Leucine-rich repeat domain-containing protein n=1 Tax=Mucilaginibacter roseus TaxID=1528868 RepID=A0ABS8U206_9SPHI|nr:hypothetical protein [Mucilaginibacter roseus]MCD8740292.1 hypothetical protein [Mucilaginibacter roseus]
MLTDKQIELGVWAFKSSLWQTLNIDDIAIYDTEWLSISTSRLNNEIRSLSPSRMKELRNAWKMTLPKLFNVKYLFVEHQIDQEFFESICKMPNLEGLYIKWSRITDLSPIDNLFKLKHLHLGSTPGLLKLNGLNKLNFLQSLELENTKGITDYSVLGKLVWLESLVITGSVNSPRVKMDTLDFLTTLTKLKVLVLYVSLKSNSIEPMLMLNNLVKLYLSDNLYRGQDSNIMLGFFPNLTFSNLGKRA